MSERPWQNYFSGEHFSFDWFSGGKYPSTSILGGMQYTDDSPMLYVDNTNMRYV